MNISYNWLRQYVDIDMSPEQLAAALTSIGLETGGIEEVESIRGGLKGLVIGKVLTCTEHPDSDHLHVTTVDLGQDGGPVQIVCGAPNVAAGQTVVVATVGTVLYDGDKEFKIKKSKIRGVGVAGHDMRRGRDRPRHLPRRYNRHRPRGEARNSWPPSSTISRAIMCWR